MIIIGGINFKTQKLADAYQRTVQCWSGGRVERPGMIPKASLTISGPALSGCVSIMALTGVDIESTVDSSPLPLRLAGDPIIRRSDDLGALPFNPERLARSLTLMKHKFLPGLKENPMTRTFLARSFSPTLDFWFRYLNFGDAIDYLFLSGSLGVGRDCPAQMAAVPVKFFNTIPFSEEKQARTRFGSGIGYERKSDLFLFPRKEGEMVEHFHFTVIAQEAGRFLELAAAQPVPANENGKNGAGE